MKSSSNKRSIEELKAASSLAPELFDVGVEGGEGDWSGFYFACCRDLLWNFV